MLRRCLIATFGIFVCASFALASEPPIATNVPPYSELLKRLEASESRIRQLESLLSPPDFNVTQTRFIDPWSWLETPDPEIAEARLQAAQSQAKEAEKKQSEKKDDGKKKAEPEKPKKWYEKYSIRGYTQFRDNEVVWLQNDSAPAQHAGDRSVGQNQNFFFRRARLILQGDVSDHMAIYLQPDFVVATPGSTDGTHFPQLRDWYADCFVDKEKVHRFRVGQSKVPFGWENLQSSSNRVPLDRTDSLNSATPNERDIGVFYYWTPEYAQKFFRDVLDQGLKGSGNYGMFGFGLYDGQGGSFLEQNENVHVVSRFTYPFCLDNGQRLEMSVQGYTGKFTVLSSPIRALGAGPSIRPAGTLETGNRAGFREERIAATFVAYPQPFGFQTEWNVGRGPALNDAQTAIEETSLTGGYVMALYKCDHCYGTSFPFIRYSHYRGGYKIQRNSPYSRIDECEFGVEWQIQPAMELTCAYAITDRTNVTAIDRVGTVPYEQFAGHLVRLQFQFNY